MVQGSPMLARPQFGHTDHQNISNARDLLSISARECLQRHGAEVLFLAQPSYGQKVGSVCLV